jgi:hypothetical protein
MVSQPQVKDSSTTKTQVGCGAALCRIGTERCPSDDDVDPDKRYHGGHLDVHSQPAFVVSRPTSCCATDCLKLAISRFAHTSQTIKGDLFALLSFLLMMLTSGSLYAGHNHDEAIHDILNEEIEGLLCLCLWTATA